MRLVAALVVACFSVGCATVFKGSNEKVNFSSDPTGAKIYVNGQYMGTAPTQLNLSSKQTYNVEFRKAGFGSRTVLVNNSVGAGWVILDVIFGLVPVIVDAATGSWFGLDSGHVAAALEAEGKASVNPISDSNLTAIGSSPLMKPVGF